MVSDTTDSGGSLFARLPWGVKIGLGLISFMYGVVIVTDTVEDPIPSTVWAVIWFAVAGYLFVRAVRLSRQS